MALCFYTECFETWDGLENGARGLGDDNQWQLYNVSENHNIPPSAVLEVACVNEYNIAAYNIGLRSTESVGEADSFRKFDLAEAESGDTYIILHVQVDSSGWVQYFAEYADRVHFDILGYWQGCDYVDKFVEFNPTSPSGWEKYALDQHGVGSGQISEIVMSNSTTDTDHILGVRTSGSILNRQFHIKEAEGSSIPNGLECFSTFVTPSGDTAGIDIWSSDIIDCSFHLAGYFSSNPGEYTEIDVVFPTPAFENTWTELDTGASGIPSGVVAQFGIGQTFATSIYVGVRETNSTIDDRKLLLDKKDADVSAASMGGVHSNIDADGKIEYFCQDISDAPLYYVFGYWNNFNSSSLAFPLSSSSDFFIKGLNPYAHYLESLTTDLSQGTNGIWQTIGLSSQGYKANCVSEIVMSQQDISIASARGARSSNSDLNRRILLRDSYDGISEADLISWHTNLDDSVELEIFTSGNISYDDCLGFGFWVGCDYIELFDTFQASSQSGWVNHDLGQYGVPAGKIAEVIIISEDENLPQSGGIRQVGSAIDRIININGTNSNTGPSPDGVDAVPMFVNTSGSNSTIQVYAGNSGNMSFAVVGYWDYAPGNYTESITEITPNTDINVWRRSDLYTDYSIPSGAVVQICLGNYRYNGSNSMGVREIDPNLSEADSIARTTARKVTIRETNDGEAGGFGIDVYTAHVNAINGFVELLHSQTNAYSRFYVFGYWDSFQLIPSTVTDQINMFMSGAVATISTSGDKGGQYPSGVSMYTYGVHKSPPCDLFIDGVGLGTASGNLYTFGVNVFRTDSEFSVEYPSGLSIYTKGSGITPESGQFDLTTHGYDNLAASGDMVVEGIGFEFGSGNLFLKVPESQTGSLNLIVYNPIDAGPGLIRTPQAVFYIKNYNDTNGTYEYVEDMDIYVPGTYFYPVEVVGDSSATTTVGDGTLPFYNSFGKGFASNKLGFALQGTEPEKQNIVGRVAYDASYPDDTADYQYPGSGSITTAFWMSGANTIASGVYDAFGSIQTTSGVRVEAGWFRRAERFVYGAGQIADATPANTIGIEIDGESGIIVRTSVRDMPYESASGGGLYWGGTTHYGTPSGTTWSWNPEVSGTYSAWNNEWPEVYIEHDDIAFFVLRSEFVASGVDGSAPGHMKVWLSVDGQPWTYIGSGVTGPPASSLYSFSNPTNRYTENAVGVKVRAINYQGGSSNVGSGWVGVAELAIWTDEDKFTNNELSDLYDVANVSQRPLDEYRPTIVPPSTYINRTVGPPIYEPIITGPGYFGGAIGSGMLVTIEIGLGAYGEDASAYLLEEVPPSGFAIRDIQPHLDVRYNLQGTRPPTQQQIFHDPQSGIMQPYNDNWGVNTYGASIRWVNHDNHPQKDERRLPTPTGIYTYKLYPISYQDSQPASEFEFSGSGLFFDGTTGSGVFLVETTGDTSGTTAGTVGGIQNRGFNLYTKGPMSPSGTINLYIRTQEKFTSAYIGTSPRTPEITDFIFAADGAAAIESMAGIEYGPALYARGPLAYEDNCPLFTMGPIGDNINFFIHGLDLFNTSSDFPSGVLLKTGEGHETFYGSGNMVVFGPLPYSGEMYMHTRAGAFEPPIDLFTRGHLQRGGATSGFIKGPEFVCTSGDFSYPLDSTLFTYPSGGKSPDLYIVGPEFICSSGDFIYPQSDSSIFTTPSGGQSPNLYVVAHIPFTGTCPLYIGPLRLRNAWTLYLKTENNDINDTVNLFTHGFIVTSGESGVVQTFNNTPFYLEAANADYPYTAGGTEAWTLFLKTQDGNLTSDQTWAMFLKADSTTPATCNFYTYGHASGESPRGNVVSSSVNFICSINPDDPRRVGFIPYDSNDNPWNLFLKCDTGHFDTMALYMSGAMPISYAASGNLFIEGLFEQETGTASLYLMGISGIFNNGPGGLNLFLDAGILVYNTSGNLYIHGY